MATMKSIRKSTQGKLSVFTRKINDLEKGLNRARKQGHPKHILDGYRRDIIKTKDAKNYFIQLNKAMNKLK